MNISAYLRRMNSAEKVGAVLGLFGSAGLVALFGKRIFLAVDLYKSGEKLENLLPYSSVIYWILGFGCVMVFMVWLNAAEMRGFRKRQSWLIDATNRNIKMLNERLNIATRSGEQFAAPAESDQPWPWGHHHTETLGHLDAAARKWWALYDPSDFTTAPTNEMVSDWLQSERRISREKARAIASMLRPDGLPTGPRR